MSKHATEVEAVFGLFDRPDSTAIGVRENPNAPSGRVGALAVADAVDLSRTSLEKTLASGHLPSLVSLWKERVMLVSLIGPTVGLGGSK